MLSTIPSRTWQLLRRGWRLLSEAHTAVWALNILGISAIPIALTGMLAFIGEHSVALLVIVFAVLVAIAAIIALVGLGKEAGVSPSQPQPEEAIIDKWWTDHFEGKSASHELPYLSAAWHHAFAAKEDLKRRLAAL